MIMFQDGLDAPHHAVRELDILRWERRCRRRGRDLLLTAALTHDLGRTREFTYGAELGLTDEGRLLGHLVIGERIISEHSASLDEPRRLALLHCVLSHHGPGTAPGGRLASVEALALYRINAVDAAIKGAFEHGLGGGAPGGGGAPTSGRENQTA